MQTSAIRPEEPRPTPTASTASTYGPLLPGPAARPDPSAADAAPAARDGRAGRWAKGAAAALAVIVLSGGTAAAVARTYAGSQPSAAPPAGAASVGTVNPPTGAAPTSWAAIAAKVAPSVVALTVDSSTQEAQGSGVIWDASGNVVTNNHVVSAFGPGAAITVQLGAQTTYRATVVGTDPTTDLAVVRLTDPPSGLTPISRAPAASVRVGDPVMALGNPLGLSGTVTTGIVSALDRPMATQAQSQGSGGRGGLRAATSSQEVVTDAIQTSAPINPGNSGGALVDDGGRLIGINSAIASLGSSGDSQPGNIGIGFAIPIQEVAGVVGQLVSSGHAVHAQLGIAITDTTVPVGQAQVAGAAVQAVTPGGPAAAAGMQQGDVVTAADGTPVTSAESLIGRIRAMSPGQQMQLTVVRNGQQLTLTVTLTAATG